MTNGSDATREPAPVKCSACEGSGKCSRCYGTGQTGVLNRVKCMRCRGNGVCPRCGGKGRIISFM